MMALATHAATLSSTTDCHDSMSSLQSACSSQSPTSRVCSVFEHLPTSSRLEVGPHICTAGTSTESFEHGSDVLTSEDYAKMACHGIKLMLDNDFSGAEKLFCQHKDNSVHMAVGYCYLTFLNAVMSFEDEQIQHCRECLKETEKKYSQLSSNPTTPCMPSHFTSGDNSWYSSVKNLLTGGCDKQSEDPVWQLERHVILADCQVLLALLNFLQQELGSVVKGGWVLRKAWRMYDATYARLVAMCAAADAIGGQEATAYDTIRSPNLSPVSLSCLSQCSPLVPGSLNPPVYSPCSPPALTAVDVTLACPTDSKHNTSNPGSLLPPTAVTGNVDTINANLNGRVTTATDHQNDGLQHSAGVENAEVPVHNSDSASSFKARRPTSLRYFSSALFPALKSADERTLASPGSAQTPTPCGSSQSSLPHFSNTHSTHRFVRLRPPTLKVSVSKSVPNIRGIFSYKLSSNNNYSPSAVSPGPCTSQSLVKRVLGAASFGYGGLQLLGSLLPPSLLRLVQVFGGLPGDRGKALQALMRTRSSDDMRAPLATLSLLWYHTIVRPFLGTEGGGCERRRGAGGCSAGVEAARLLLLEMMPRYPRSALFIFFTARVHRLKGELPSAVEQYSAAMSLTSHRELQLLSLHELGWCRLACLDFDRAAQAFNNLRKHSRWCNTFYAYVAAVSVGASGNPAECRSQLQGVPCLARNTNAVLEAFLLKRAAKSISADPSVCRLRCYELLYMWNVLPCCSVQHLQRIHADCENMRLLPEQTALARLIAGVALDLLQRGREALLLLQEAIEVWKAPRPKPRDVREAVAEAKDLALFPTVTTSTTATASVAMCGSEKPVADVSSEMETEQQKVQKERNESKFSDKEIINDNHTSGLEYGVSETGVDLKLKDGGGADANPTSSPERSSDACMWDEENIPAYACYEIGFILSWFPESARESRKWLLEARDKYSGYDFESRLSVKIHQALRNSCS